MASNDPIASQARKPALSIEDAERFASQIRPSWELFGPDASAADFGLDDAPGVAAPAAGSVSRAPDTIIEGVRPVIVAGSDETVPTEESWDADAAAAPKASEPEAPPIEAKVIASIGISSKADVPVSELPLPPQVGHPMVPTPGAPIAPVPAAKTKLGVGGTSGEIAPMAKPKPTRAPVTDAPVSAKAAAAPVSAKAAAAPASAKAVTASASGTASVSRSRPGATNPGAAEVPVDADANDDIEIPISGASKGLLLKIGGGVAAVAAILLAVKLFSGSGTTDPGKVPAAVTATAAATAPPLAPTAAPEPPKATGQAAAPTAAPTVAATAAPTVAATAAPAAKEKPVIAKVEPTPPVAVVKKVAPPPPTGGSTPPVVVKKKGGGIIRETPF
jgi:hypothetical protein